MLRIIRAGQPIPSWLERFEVTGETRKTTFIAGACLLVVAFRGHYRVRPLLPGFKALMVVDGKAKSVFVSGQSPKGGDGMVYLYTNPVIGLWLLGLIAGVCLCLLWRN